MRGTKAKALRRLYTNDQGVLFKASYKAAKRGKLGGVEPPPKPDKRRKPLPVAPRAGAKPMHLVRKLVELRAEMGHSTPKFFLKVWGATPKPLLAYMLRDAKEIGDLRPYVTQKD